MQLHPYFTLSDQFTSNEPYPLFYRQTKQNKDYLVSFTIISWSTLCKKFQVKVVLENIAQTPEKWRLKLDGTMVIQCSNGTSSEIFFDRTKGTAISGIISKNNKTIKLVGFWDKYLQK